MESRQWPNGSEGIQTAVTSSSQTQSNTQNDPGHTGYGFQTYDYRSGHTEEATKTEYLFTYTVASGNDDARDTGRGGGNTNRFGYTQTNRTVILKNYSLVSSVSLQSQSNTGFVTDESRGDFNSYTFRGLHYYETSVNAAGTTTSSRYERNETQDNSYYSYTYTSSTSYPYDVTLEDSGSTANTGTLWLANGWFLVDEYPNSTNSFARSTVYGGGTQGGTISFAQNSQITVTLEDAAGGTTTAIHPTTTLGTSPEYYSRSVATLTTTTRDHTQSVWDGAGTDITVVPQTVTSTTSRSASSGEIFTQGETFLVYASPTVRSDRKYTQAAYAVANTAAGEFFWGCTGNFAYFEGGGTVSSIEFTGQTSFRTTEASVRTMNDTDSWPNATFSYTQVAQSLSATITSTAYAIAPAISVTVLGGGTSTTNQVFDRTRNTTTWEQRSGTAEVTQSGQADGFFTTAGDLATGYYDGIGEGVAVRWDTSANSFGLMTHQIQSHNVYVTNGLSTRVLLQKRTGSGETNGTDATYATARTREEGRSSTEGYEIAGAPEKLYSAVYANSVGLRAAGPRAQLPPNLGYTATEGLNYGGAELFYPIVSVDGATLRTPLMGPLTSSRVSGVSASTYSYDEGIGGVRGTKISNSSATTTTTQTSSNSSTTTTASTTTSRTAVTSSFSSAFTPPAAQPRFFGPFNEGYAGDSSMTRYTNGFQVVGGSVRVGNNEAWTGPRGALTVNEGAVRVTTESNNVTGSVNTYYALAIEQPVGNTQAAFEPGWAATRGSSTYNIGSYARVTALASQHISFTA